MPGYDLSKARANARKIGVTVKPSTRKGKKLDVFRGSSKLASIGATGYTDYTVHRDTKRRDNYKSRFERTRKKKGTASYFADRILWS